MRPQCSQLTAGESWRRSAPVSIESIRTACPDSQRTRPLLPSPYTHMEVGTAGTTQRANTRGLPSLSSPPSTNCWPGYHAPHHSSLLRTPLVRTTHAHSPPPSIHFLAKLFFKKKLTGETAVHVIAVYVNGKEILERCKLDDRSKLAYKTGKFLIKTLRNILSVNPTITLPRQETGER